MQQEVQLFLAIQKKKKRKNLYWLPSMSIQMCECMMSVNKTMQVLLLCSCSQSARSSGGVQGSVEAVQAILEEGGEETTLRIRE